MNQLRRATKRQAIKDYVIDWIRDHDLKFGDAIQSQNVLAEYFNVTAVTVHKALTELVSEGTIHRRQGSGTFVGPDNGVFSLALRAEGVNVLEAVTLTNPDYQLSGVSATFHGRDIFAPAAAFLARGTEPDRLGPAAINLVQIDHLRLPEPGQPVEAAHIIHVDHFGNLILNITELHLDRKDNPRFTIAGQTIPRLSRTFADVAAGELLAYVGSSHGHLEIAVRNGSAARRLGVKAGARVTVSRG